MEVTDRGQPVALLMPLPERTTALGRLIAEGRATPPAGRLEELAPPLRLNLRVSLSEALEEERQERL